MKKLLMIVSALAALSLLAPSSSFANPANGYMGLFFESGLPGEDVSCITGAFLDHKTAYVVYLNPIVTSTRGFEAASIFPNRARIPRSSIPRFPFPIRCPLPTWAVNTPPSYNYITGYGTAQVITGAAFVLATLDIFVLDAGQLDFTLRASIPSSGGTTPNVMQDDFSFFNVALIQDVGSPTLTLNPVGPCGVILPTEDVSWGAVKSLFR